MVRKRSNVCINIDSSQDCDSVESEDIFGSEDIFDSEDNHSCASHGIDHSHDGDHERIKRAAYKEVLKDFADIKILKRKLALSLSREETKSISVKPSKDAFTRFSVSTFSSVVESLTPENRKVIEDFGFGSLLQFDRCFVPSKFVKWVARHVNYRSANIVFNGKVISLTKESVHLVLGLPLSNKCFPSDPSLGKSIVLSKFAKQSIPPVTFFSKKLIDHEVLSDEEVFICFIMVAMNSFLCSNLSLTPSPKYFGIFEDIGNAKDLDWCGFVLDWLLDGVKSFNKAKHSDGGVLPGCLYYLAVLYLDYVDFGARQVPLSVPRISVWKGSMIRDYADFDSKSPGCYGYHPLLDISRTCFSKLVLDLMKLVADTIATGDENIKEDSSQHVNAATQLQNSPNVKYPVLVCSITS
ncbi:uncharacterized protein LOC120689112 [Panicum virgatum]|uniref:uncharacterized protein LOC120689112 n=1 Tax=Panicum virgatum TaxID=38727 RepID=UPI0019D659AE|nr:uncharacterized protein LOC120689112 [Panicum virgatum]